MTVQIYGFDHDELMGGGKAGITFGLKNLMAETKKMRSTNTNVNGYNYMDQDPSVLKHFLDVSVYSELPIPTEIIKIIKARVSVGGGSSSVSMGYLHIFPFSEVEIFGTTTYSVPGEGSQYEIFKGTDAFAKIKRLANGTGAANSWWLRSPRSNSSTEFCIAYNHGSAGFINASTSLGVCFGFCV